MELGEVKKVVVLRQEREQTFQSVFDLVGLPDLNLAHGNKKLKRTPPVLAQMGHLFSATPYGLVRAVNIGCNLEKVPKKTGDRGDQPFTDVLNLKFDVPFVLREV